MTAEQIAKWMAQMNQVLTLVKLVVGLFISSAVATVAAVLWFSNTTQAIASTRIEVQAFNKDYLEKMRELAAWKSEMERLTTRTVTVQEQQQKLMERLTDRVDRINR